MTDSTTENTRRPTIYDIAALAGASASAVSSVLNGTWKKRRISKKLAERVMRIADEQGYAVNVQASLLRRQKSNIVGMVIPKYDNRYFAEIAETFESLARDNGLFPVITCTQRDPELEVEAARELIAYKVECVFVTGATDPDHMTDLFKAGGVQSINIDLPGKDAPSVLSDNYTGARQLSELLLDRCQDQFGSFENLKFVGGRLSDNNTAARLRGFQDAASARGLKLSDCDILVQGYSPDRTFAALSAVEVDAPLGIFVNSTISLEGAMRWLTGIEAEKADMVRYACFDWDPFGAFLPGIVGMARQNVGEMMRRAFDMMGQSDMPNEQTLVPCSIHEM